MTAITPVKRELGEKPRNSPPIGYYTTLFHGQSYHHSKSKDAVRVIDIVDPASDINIAISDSGADDIR